MRIYGARDKNTGKLVAGITNPSRKFWQRKGDCERAINNYNWQSSRFGWSTNSYDLELVEFELVEVKETD